MTPELDFLDTFLSDVEKNALAQVADSVVLLNALKKVLLTDVYFKGTLIKDVAPDPTRNAALALAFTAPTTSNEVLGQDVRAQAEGVRLVESGFKRLETFKTDGKPKAGKPKTGR